MLYDGDCSFCAFWIARWGKYTHGAVRYMTYQAYLADPSESGPKISERDLEAAVHLINEDGSITRGAEAVFQCLNYGPRGSRSYRLYQKSKLFAGITEWSYRRVANNRTLLSRINGWIFRKKAPACSIRRED